MKRCSVAALFDFGLLVAFENTFLGVTMIYCGYG